MSQSSLQPITFEEAILQTEEQRRYLLLGNGFSINFSNIFNYKSLFEEAQPYFSADVAAIFQNEKTNDFEKVLSSEQGQSYENEIRTAFHRVLAKVHPKSASLSQAQVDNCVKFLKYFVGTDRKMPRDGKIYTTNYDLLLYWVVVRSKGKRLVLNCKDGHSDDQIRLWDTKINPSLIYLHGALHLYDLGVGQEMLRFGDKNIIEQTRIRLDQGRFPAIVAEGTSEAKVARIQRSNYLKRMKKYFETGLKDKDAVLFTYGHSLDDRDAHFLELIAKKPSKIKAVYIGAYKGFDGPDAPNIRKWTKRWNDIRFEEEGEPLKVWIYDTEAYSPWR